MVTRGFADLPEDRSIVRALARERAQNFGVYASVVEPGTVAAGDTVTLL
jgi:MOSC domain-containing protein YiiM